MNGSLHKLYNPQVSTFHAKKNNEPLYHGWNRIAGLVYSPFEKTDSAAPAPGKAVSGILVLIFLAVFLKKLT